MILSVKLIARIPMHSDVARRIRSHAAVFCDKRYVLYFHILH